MRNYSVTKTAFHLAVNYRIAGKFGEDFNAKFSRYTVFCIILCNKIDAPDTL